MSRFQKLSQTIWHCQYHIVWVPKYRFRILNGAVAAEVKNCIRAFSHRKGCKILGLNVQNDHVHLLVMVPPKVSISDYVGMLKGLSAIRVFNKFKWPKTSDEVMKISSQELSWLVDGLNINQAHKPLKYSMIY